MNSASSQPANRLHLKIADGIQFVNYSDIIRLEAQGKHILVFVHSTSEPYKAAGTMDEFEKQLDNKSFFRCHRSHIVNIRYIEKYVSKALQLVTAKGEVPLAESKLSVFKSNILNKI